MKNDMMTFNGNTQNNEDVFKLTEKIFGEIRDKALSDPVRKNEVTSEKKIIKSIDRKKGEKTDVTLDVCTIEKDGKKLLYTMEVIGDPDENGLYPLYIAFHGGGGGPKEGNNQQWIHMTEYYRDSVTNGIYIATRGMEDVWNLHFLDYSYSMYDRLIEDMILLKNADPNRVYLMGFSAGGDGVYAVAPRMADKFAAVNMSAGHPNGVSLLNTSNLPFEIEVGVRDFYSEQGLRSVRGAEYEGRLNGHREKYGFGYPHRVLVHVPYGHNFNDRIGGAGDTCVLTDPAMYAERAVKENWLKQFMDIFTSFGNDEDIDSLSYAYDCPEFNEKLKKYITDDLSMKISEDIDSNAVHYVSGFRRNPVPKKFIFDLSTRAPYRTDKAFYWLRAEYDVNKGVICASYDEDSNSVTLETDGNVNGDIAILANPFLMDFGRPLTVKTSEGEYVVKLEAKEDIIRKSLSETGDIYLSWADEISCTKLENME